jgi:Sulfite exporter TauE/SafE.
VTLDFLLLFGLGAAAGGFVNGLAGFGTALFALAFWLEILPPAQAVAISAVMSVTSGLPGLWAVREAISRQPRRILRFVLPALVAVPLGVLSLQYVEAGWLKLVIGGFMGLYGLFFAFRRTLPALDLRMPVADMAVGFSGGFLGGAASLSGALPTMWCTLHAWTRQEQRGVMQPFNVTILGATVVLLAFQGAYTAETLLLIAGALPVTMLAAQVGARLFARLTDAQFKRLLILLLFVSGASILVQELGKALMAL